MKLLMTLGLMMSPAFAYGQTTIKCTDFTRAGLRAAEMTTTADGVRFTLHGSELWGGEGEAEHVDLVTTDGEVVGVENYEPGQAFDVKFPRSQCLTGGRSTLCRGADQTLQFRYWPTRVEPRRQVTLTVAMEETSVIFGSGRVSLNMVMRRPDGSLSIHNASYSCMRSDD